MPSARFSKAGFSGKIYLLLSSSFCSFILSGPQDGKTDREKRDEEDSAVSGNEAGQRCTEVKAANANEGAAFAGRSLQHNLWRLPYVIGYRPSLELFLASLLKCFYLAHFELRGFMGTTASCVGENLETSGKSQGGAATSPGLRCPLP
ncbi:hypothetical protein Q8A73_022735 [Channa argus]|nr:hypothetical protein Q8A73_022735 [Channa argus]